MRTGWMTALFFILTTLKTVAQPCDFRLHPMPVLSDSTRVLLESKYKEARLNYDKDSTDSDAIIWYGRRTAYLGNYKAAISLFTKGIEKFPEDARFFRHRGHRYITLRCTQAAIIDLIQAAEKTRGKPDEVEPDGLPNVKNIPTSTLQGNIWYHLALALYLEKDYNRSEQAWRECLRLSGNPDMYVASAYWLYITLRRAGKEKEAADLLDKVPKDLQLIENVDYYTLLLLYKGVPEEKKLESVSGKPANELSNATLGYGMGVFSLLTGNKEEAKRWFTLVLAGNQWSSFGFIAAESEDMPVIGK